MTVWMRVVYDEPTGCLVPDPGQICGSNVGPSDAGVSLARTALIAEVTRYLQCNLGLNCLLLEEGPVGLW